jgi:hypothetical protein
MKIWSYLLKNKRCNMCGAEDLVHYGENVFSVKVLIGRK